MFDSLISDLALWFDVQRSSLPEIVLTDDHHQIPRSTSVIIRRIAPNPKLKNGGTAARYIAGTSNSVGGRDDLVDRRVEQSSREELMNKRGMGGLGRGGGMLGKGNMTVRFDKKDEEDVGRHGAFFDRLVL